MTHASLFSGIGGPEVAATMLGWDNLFHCEINDFGRKILDYWYPNSKSYEDITKTDFSEWRGKVDVLTGGFPCQPFSYAGKRRGADDDRYLWPFMFKAIDQIRPTWVVAENVAGIATMVEQGEVSEMGGQASIFEEVDGLHRYRLAETFTLQRICDDLEGHGYSVQPVLVPACAVGAPHRRDRVFIVGHLTDTNGTRQSASDKPSGQTRQTMDGERSCQSFDGTERPCTLRPIADTDNNGSYRRDGNDGQGRPLHPDTERNASSESERHRLRREPRTVGKAEHVADTIHEDTMHSGFLHGQHEVEGHQRNERDISAGGSERLSGIASRFEDTEAIAGCERWDAFPSVSPVHRGNDGLPFDVDSLSIPFSKWRTESLKAYGNAIVPQVMYEIFRAIELVEKETN